MLTLRRELVLLLVEVARGWVVGNAVTILIFVGDDDSRILFTADLPTFLLKAPTDNFVCCNPTTGQTNACWCPNAVLVAALTPHCRSLLLGNDAA